MAAVFQSSPPSHSSRRVFIENPLTFTVRLSRQQWRDMRFERLIDPLPWPGEPRLVFDESRYLSALKQQDLFEHAVADYLRAAPASTPSKVLFYLQNRVRRCHVGLVNMAIGYTWPGNPPGWIEFAE